MKKSFFFSLALCTSLFSSNLLKDSFYGYKPIIIEKEHKKEEEKHKKNEEKHKIPIIITDKYLDTLSVPEYRKVREEVRNIAILKPTENNILNDLKMKYYQDKKATEYMNKTKLITLQHPELNPALNVEVSTYSRNLKANEKKYNTKEFYKKQIDNLALIVFFKPEEFNKNKALERVLNMLIRDYKINVRYLNLDNKNIIELMKRKKIYSLKTPDLFLFYKGNNKNYWLRVASGVQTADRIIKEIEFLFKHGIKERDIKNDKKD